LRQKFLDIFAAARYISIKAMPQGGNAERNRTAAGRTGREAHMAKKKVKELQHEVAESAHKIWLAGLGAVAMAEEEGGKLFQTLVKKGQGVEVIGKEKVDKAKGAVSGVKVVAESYLETIERTIDEKITAAIHKIGVPTKAEIDELSKKVEDLSASISKVKTPAAKPATRTRSTAKKAPARKTTTKTTKK
jgi:poly(hydroxyalkanoate) granule-associated protein